MAEIENEENIKNTIQDTQMLIRNHMQQHKKISKQLHSQIKKDLKTIELFKEKIGKLIVEKEKLEAKQQNKADNKDIMESSPDIEKIRQLRKVFSLLNLQDRGSVSVSQLQEILEKYKFIKIPLEELISFLNKMISWKEVVSNLPNTITP